MNNEIFIDWVTASQLHSQGGLPILSGGVLVQYDGQGVPRYERNQSASFEGSYESRIRIGCDGFRVSVSGNVGRFSRKNNLYNFGWEDTKKAINRILTDIGLPIFTASEGFEGSTTFRRGAVVSRLDVTCNYATGSENIARAAITYLASKSLSRMKKGHSGSDSVWFANTRHMLKAYIKASEMLAHGCDKEDPSYLYALEQGLLRVELELKKRFLSDEKMNDWADITQEKLENLFHESTSLLKGIDTNSDIFTIDDLPSKSRIYASAWLAGQDIRTLLPERTFYRQAKILREHGIDITEKRNVKQFPVKVRFLDLKPTVAPEWYQQENKYTDLRLVA